MSSTREVEELIAQIHAVGHGPEEREMIRRALAMVAELDNPDLEYRLRMRQTSSAVLAGDMETALISFPWCLSWHDVDPERFPHRVDTDDLFWQFKWMYKAMTVNPKFSLAQADSLIDDMERRYAAAGIGMAGVLQTRFASALDTGRYADAKKFLDQRNAVGPDEYSDCEACTRSRDADWFYAVNDDEGGLKIFDEIIAGNYTCAEEPEGAQGHALLALLRAGRFDEAKYHHRQAIRWARAADDPLPLILPHLPFLAVTGNLASAFTLLEQYLPMWVRDPIDMAIRHEAAISFGVVLDAITAAGHGEIPVRGSDSPILADLLGERSTLLTVSQLARRCWRIADSIANSFDERNGTDRFTTRTAAAQALADVHYDLPLTGPIPLDVDIPAASPRTAADYLASSRLRIRLTSDTEEAWSELQTGLDLAEGPDRTAILYDIMVLTFDLGLAGGEAAVEAYAAALDAAGRPAEAQFYRDCGVQLFSGEQVDLSRYAAHEDERLRVLYLWYQLRSAWDDGNDEQAGILYDQLLLLTHKDLAEFGENARVHQMHIWLEQEPEKAAALAAELADSAQPWVSYVACQRLAQYLFENGQQKKAVSVAERGLEISRRFAIRALVMSSATLSATALAEDGRLAEAIDRQRVAVRQAQLADLPSEAGLRFQLGRWLADAGRGSEAADEFETVAALEKSQGDGPDELAVDLLNLALAVRDEDPERAHAGFTQASELAEQSGKPELILQTGLAFGHFLMSFNDSSAVSVVENLLKHLDTVPEARLATMHALGRARCQFGEAGGLDDLAKALNLAQEAGAAWEIADITDSVGRALLQLDHLEEGVSKLLSAADLYAECGDTPRAGISEVTAARALGTAGRNMEAATAYEAARSRLADHPDLHTGASLEFAAFLDHMGDPERAAALRAEVADRDMA